MKTIAIGSFFVLFALVGLVATTPAAFADHPEVVVEPAMGSGVAGCQDEPEGCYIPSEAAVDVGGVVIFDNTDNVAHTFTAGTAELGPTGEFDSGLVITGASWEFSPDTAGEIQYFCIVHPWMEGVIVAQAASDKMDGDKTHGDKMDGDHMDGDKMDGDKMMRTEASATGMLPDGTMVKIWAAEPTEGEMLEVIIKFKDEDGMMKEHVNYDMMVMQEDKIVLNDEGAHEHEGKGTHMTAPLDSSDPVEITVKFQGYGVNDPKTGPIGEEVSFANIVPEFGTIAMMVLAVAIISIIAVTAKSRVIPRL